jgi:hypothetical protein
MNFFPLAVLLPSLVLGVLGVGTWADTPRWAILIMVLVGLMLAWAMGWSFGTSERRKVEDRA